MEKLLFWIIMNIQLNVITLTYTTLRLKSIQSCYQELQTKAQPTLANGAMVL